MKTVLTVGGLAPELGGPSRSIPALAEALARESVEVELIARQSQAGHGAPVLPDAKRVKTRLLPADARQGHWRARRNEFFRAICESARSRDTVIHDNGVWLPTNHAVAAAARSSGRPLVISPRGMLSEWASQHHGWKKRLAWLLFQRRDFLRASALHATSMQECNDCRRAGFRGPVAIVPNGIDLPELSGAPREERATRMALCVARLHPVKGLMNLVHAWSEVRPPGWRMVIAGGDENGHRAELQAAVERHHLSEAFEFPGPVEGGRKRSLYREADLFILPSYSENFGMGIAEALANGVPVITTRGTPWKDLIEHNCGWWQEVGAAPLGRALREATALDPAIRRKMGARGRELVAQKYSWTGVAKELKSVYRWLLGHAECPGCVMLT